MKILLATDGSEFSQAAADSVAKRPWPAGSEVKILSVIEPFQPYLAEVYTTSDEFWEKLEEASREQAVKAVVSAKASFANAPQPIEIITQIQAGIPKGTILDEAEAWGADLIVLGSHGYTGLKRAFLGSVSLAIASHAKCSVEIVRKPEAMKVENPEKKKDS